MQGSLLAKITLKQVHQSMHDDELKQVLDNGYINQKQVRNFKQSQHMLEMESKRESSLGRNRQTGKSQQR